RDLKPANIMVDTEGQSWLIDFGLAGRLQRPENLHVEGQPEDSAEPLTSAHDVPGTVGYMAPEQKEEGGHDARIDVWGLGVTLYELLTLRRAFPVRPATQPGGSDEFAPPVPPRKHISNIPRDLEAICLKALQEAPDGRYQTAREFGEDLDRWLRGKPTVAHPAQAPRRAYLWARRNKGWATAIAAAVLALLALCASGIAAFFFQRARAEANEARAGASEARAQAEERESLVLKFGDLLRPGQSDGWSARAWDLERKMVKLGRDHRVRDQTAAILGGLDAPKSKQFRDFGANSAVFDLSGKRLLVSTVTGPKQQPGKPKLWNVDTDEVQDLMAVGQGPVGFRADGTPLQLAARQKELVLLDLAKGDVLLRLDLPQGAIVDSSGLMAMTKNGLFVAAAVTAADGKSSLLAWNGASGKRLAQLPFSEKATALQLSPDGSLIAVGKEDGGIEVWSTNSAAQVASLQSRQIKIHALAFDRDRRRVTAPAGSAHGWLLAAGDAGGDVTIWDLGSKIPRSYCRGNLFDVYAVAFSPDGVTLAASGRGPIKLWDVATGNLLLNFNAGDFAVCLAFSPDGRNLAVGSADSTTPSGGMLSVWRLEAARGLHRLRGLEAQVSKVCFSQDGRLVAALGHNWEVAIWELPNGFLRHVLTVPQGLSADNAAMAFSPDGSRFAFTAGREARSWDVGSGAELNRWKLYEGFVDVLAYAGPDKLLSFRVEAKDGKRSPFDTPRMENPLVCRLRQLPDRAAARLIKEIPDFNWHVYTAATPPMGQYFVVDGLTGPGGQRRMIEVFDDMGKEIAPIPTTRTRQQQYGWLLFDPTGRLLVAMVSEAERAVLLEMRSAKPAEQFDFVPYCLAPGGKYWAHIGQPATRERPEDSVHGVSLFRGGEKEPVVVFDFDSLVQSVQTQFDATGALFAWGRTDGTVAVCNIPEVKRRLAELGLDW
ncbi:MAG: protein kinase, partial [Thermoguttaceae bacterium]